MDDYTRQEWARPASDAAAQRLRAQLSNASYMLITPPVDRDDDWPTLPPAEEECSASAGPRESSRLYAFTINHLGGSALIYGIVVCGLTVAFMLSLPNGQPDDRHSTATSSSAVASASAEEAQQRQLAMERDEFRDWQHSVEVANRAQPSGHEASMDHPTGASVSDAPEHGHESQQNR
jgi:hypothetical protein